MVRGGLNGGSASTTNTVGTWGMWNQTYYLGSASLTNVTCTGTNWPFTQGQIITGSASATNITSATTIWTGWNQAYTELTGTVGTAAQITIANAWPHWLEEQDLRRAQQPMQARAGLPARPSEAEVARALEQERQWRLAAEEKAKKAMEAEKRAEDLLRDCLSAEQIDQLKSRNFFYVEVEGRHGRKERYRIDRGSHGNVKQVDEKGSIIRSFCIQPSGVPVPDVMLAQKLWLEASDESRAEFWETANITPIVREKDVPYNIPRRERYRYAAEHGLLH